MISKSVLEQLEYPKIIQLITKFCHTLPGKEFIQNLTPYEFPHIAISEGELVNQAKSLLIQIGNPPIDYVENLSHELSTSKIDGSILPAKKILQILELAVVSRSVYQFLKLHQEIAPKLFNLSSSLFIDKVFEHHITSVLNENGEVKDNASRKLIEIRKEMKSKNEELLHVVNRLMKSFNEQDFVREDYVTLRDGRIVVPIKAEHKRHIRGFIHSESATGQTIYIEPQETLNLNNDIVSLFFAEQREIERILKELTSKIGGVSDSLKQSQSTIAHLDAIFAKAVFSSEINGSFPTINNEDQFFLKDVYHPVLLNRLGREKTVPLSLKVENLNVVLVTGPNAGGKTVALKTIGLISILAQSGIHIPASPDSNIHFYEKILLDIGDKQSIEDDLSTFSSHLSNIKKILDYADSRTLVILDEIGTGTEPSAGSAIAAAVLLKLRDKKSLVLAATHLGTLKLIAQSTPGFQNASMEFDTKDLRPTYLFRQGMPGSSYAFEIAKRIGLDENFIQLASQFVDSGQDKVEKMLIDVELKSNTLKTQLNELTIENSRLKGLSSLYEKKVDKLEKEKKEILKKTKEEAERYLRTVNKTIEEVIKELRENKAGKESIRIARETIKNLVNENKNLINNEVEIESEKHSFAVGEYASIKNTSTVGKITEISKDGKSLYLIVGSVKLNVNIDELIPAKKEKVSSDNKFISNVILNPEYRLDIRGQKPEECEFNIIKFLDSAYTSGLERVEILHGKGTGVLKKVVKDLLTSHQGVKNFHFAPVEYGGEGITIVEFK